MSRPALTTRTPGLPSKGSLAPKDMDMRASPSRFARPPDSVLASRPGRPGRPRGCRRRVRSRPKDMDARASPSRFARPSVSVLASRCGWPRGCRCCLAPGVTPLFPSVQDVEPGARNVHLQRLKEMGPYGSMQELLQLHIDLISEDYLCALHDQLNTLRLNPELLDTPDHYEIRGDAERFLTRGRFQHPMGIEFHFDASLYSEVEWDEEKRLMRNNLVFLTDNNLQDFVVGLIHASGQKLLQKGCIIIKIIKGFDDRGYPVLDDQAPFIGKTWRMVESSQFHFPFLQVTNILRKEIGMVTLRNSFGMAFEFYDEIVYGIVQPAKEPRYTSEMETLQIRRLRRDMRDELNSSQYTALKKVLKQRVALVQGPPGTGKTYLGGKVAQLLVSLKRLYPNVLSGPILVVAMSNHAVQEFLVRCKAFSDKRSFFSIF
ncbi:hypothetical protein FOCC_FOCC013776 [Frankliniella occidentalis]|nr:hypothetical protein FOCC_FOCC013776 [Frankliniella occidentalis]